MESRFNDNDGDRSDNKYDEEHIDESRKEGKSDKTQSVLVKLVKEVDNGKDGDSKEAGGSKEADTQQIEVNQNNSEKEEKNQQKNMKEGEKKEDSKVQKNIESSNNDGETPGKFKNRNGENKSENMKFNDEEDSQDVKVSFGNSSNKHQNKDKEEDENTHENMKFNDDSKTQNLEVNQQQQKFSDEQERSDEKSPSPSSNDENHKNKKLHDSDKNNNDDDDENTMKGLKNSNKFIDNMKEETHDVHVDEKLDSSDKVDNNDKNDESAKFNSNDKNDKNSGKESNQKLAAQDSSSHNKNSKGGNDELNKAMVNDDDDDDAGEGKGENNGQPSKSVNLDKESSSFTSASESNNKEPNSKQQNDKNEPKPSKEKHVSGVSLEDRLPAKVQKLVESGKLDASDLPTSRPSPTATNNNQNTDNGQLPTDKVQSDLLNSQLAPVSKPSSLGQQVTDTNTGQKPGSSAAGTIKVKEGTDHEGNNFAHYTDHPTSAQEKTADKPTSAVLPPQQEQQPLQPSHHLNTPEVISPAEQNRLLPPEVIGPIVSADNSNIPVTEKIGHQEIQQQQHQQPLLIHLSDEHPEMTDSRDPLTLGQVDNTLVASPDGKNIKESTGLGVDSSFRFASFGSPVILHIGATGFGEGKLFRLISFYTKFIGTIPGSLYL